MAVEPQQMIVEGLTNLMSGILGVTIGAWLAGIYKIKGEITGRAEKMDAILNEVRLTAKAKELSEVAARAEGISAIVNEVAQTTKASEGAKIATRLEKLDQILPEVRAVTETQKRIEANVAGGEWDRQWRLNQIREGYGRLLGAVYGLQDYFYLEAYLSKAPDQVSEAAAREADQLYRKHAADFKTGAALTRIFAGGMASWALGEYDKSVQERVRLTPASARPQKALNDLADLHEKLIDAARADLHVSADTAAG